MSVDGIRIGVNRLFVRGGPLHSNLKVHHTLGVFTFKVNNVFVDHGEVLRFVQEFYVVQQTVFVEVSNGLEALGGRPHLVQRQFLLGLVITGDLISLKLLTLVGQRNGQTLIQERHLLEARTQRLKIELYSLKN